MSTGTAFTPWYEPTPTRGHFTKHTKYDEVLRDRGDLGKLVDHFERRLRGWYIEPIEVLLETNVRGWRMKLARFLARRDEGGHYSFSVAAMTCLLIDTLSQFEKGKLESDNVVFKDFVRRNLPCYAGSLTPNIDGYRPPRNPTGAPRHQALSDIADVLYSGFRCGILHEAHAPLYCWISPGNDPPTVEATGYATYGLGATSSTAGNACPTVKLQPGHLFNEVMRYFRDYLSKLKNSNPIHDQLRVDFKTKFSHSFGVDILNARL
ncbi:hypothetical protein Pan97_38910 [Bremerella volcania]|uniref:Uncharacterized protein n=1 Tax=Bremerella volcania TaxID=2527984 RepID=A0A518CCB0_9BACT|nr:hypothetical protein Pan97_38910 [Bremerella volcania]